tara:strand:- start:632 stop:961 length:330 start_codon:yes stop_codon:yes gene_type:complete
MDLEQIKVLMRDGIGFEMAYGICMRRLCSAEGQLPNHKVQEARRKSAGAGAMRPNIEAIDKPKMVEQIDAFLQAKIHQKDIAKALRISQYSVSKIKKRYNLPTKRFDDE